MRYNGTFAYQNSLQLVSGVDPQTGFPTSDTQAQEWVEGGLCQIDYQEGRTRKNADGQDYYTPYTLFVPKCFEGDIEIGAHISVVYDDGSTDTFDVKGIDAHNRKYFEIWG